MRLVKAGTGSPYLDMIGRTNLEAFPPEEQLPVEVQADMCDKGELDLWALCEGDSYRGFTSVYKGERSVYVFFLAIDSSCRAVGCGTGALKLIRGAYPGRQVVLDIEPLDPQVKNAAQRVRRKGFYLRNAFHESGWLFKYCGMSFEVLWSGGGSFDRDAYWSLIQDIARSVEAQGYKGFNPSLEKLSDKPETVD
mgnify:CR=1 FL=1